MKQQRSTSTWKEEMVALWEKMVSTYITLRNSPSVKLVLKFIFQLLKIILSIVVKRIIQHFFPNF